MKQRENFGSRMAVIMAFAGSAIGLGNIWRFPYLVGQDGGAAFVVIYVLATLVISLPIFFAESVVGRRTGANCRGAFIELGKGTAWPYLGFLMCSPLCGSSPTTAWWAAGRWSTWCRRSGWISSTRRRMP